MAAGVRDIDKGYKRRMKAARKLARNNGSYVDVGIHSDAGEHPSGASVIEIAGYHEFGTDTIPQRSFVRDTVDQKKDDIDAAQKRLATLASQGKLDPHIALERLGLMVKGEIQSRMHDGIPPPLKYRDGTPLIDTGHLRSKVDYKVKG